MISAPHATMQAMKALISPLPLAIALLAACALPAHAQIKRWVDERGVVHPATRRPSPVTSRLARHRGGAPAQPLSPADQAPCARLEQYRQDLAKPAASAAPAAAAPGMKPRVSKTRAVPANGGAITRQVLLSRLGNL